MDKIVLAVVTLLGILYVLYPIFLSKKDEKVLLFDRGMGEKINSLLEHKMVIFSSVKELEFEYETGKLSQEDYEKLREEYKTKVIYIYKEIDELTITNQQKTEDSSDQQPNITVNDSNGSVTGGNE